jgi:hypothetical protein
MDCNIVYDVLKPITLLFNDNWSTLTNDEKLLFTENFIKVIEYREYVLSDIAKECNISEDKLHNIIANDEYPNYDELCSIANYFNIPVLRLTHTQLNLTDLIVLDSVDKVTQEATYISVLNDLHNDYKYSKFFEVE